MSVPRRRGLVERDERGRYRPGIGLLALGETFFVVAARGGRLTVLDKVEGTGFVRVAPRVGSTIPAQVTAVGKLYLAHAPQALAETERRRERSAVRALPAAELELSLVRRRGYAENLGEPMGGEGQPRGVVERLMTSYDALTTRS